MRAYEVYEQLRRKATEQVAEGDDWAQRCRTGVSPVTGSVFALLVHHEGGRTFYGLGYNFGDVEWYTSIWHALDAEGELRRLDRTAFAGHAARRWEYAI